MRFCYDATSVAALPRPDQLSPSAIVATYVDHDGHDGTAELEARYPHHGRLLITEHAEPGRGKCVDVEPGATWPPSKGAEWAKNEHDAGRLWPWLYCNIATWPAVIAAVANADMTGKVHYWIAWEHDDEWGIPMGAIGRQYQLSPGSSPGPYDVSVFADHIEGFDAPQVHGTPLRPGATSDLRDLDQRLGNRRHPVATRRRLIRRTIAALRKALK
jgi:hypothetical protein